MIPTYEQMGDWLEEIVGEFPDAFFEELDGGIQLEEAALPDPDFPPGEMYIMGEYCHDMLGRYIVLYYGSFAALLPEEDEEGWKDELFATVAHEFTHHMEETAGLHGGGRGPPPPSLISKRPSPIRSLGASQNFPLRSCNECPVPGTNR